MTTARKIVQLTNLFPFFSSTELKTFGPTMCAAYAGSMLTRECNRRAFQIHKRSMTTTDMIPMVPHAFHDLFEDESKLQISSNM